MLPYVNAIATLLHYVNLMKRLHHIGHVQISNDAKVNVTDGAYQDFEDHILDIPEGSTEHRCGHAPCGNAPPLPPRPPVSLEQLLATQNDLMRRLVENDERRGAERQQPQHQERDSSNSDFLATPPLVFTDVTDPLEADSWLHTTESKFELHHCTEYQKTLYATHQLRGSTRAWWATYTTTLPTDHHVP
jgi:hypothetical protein